MCIRIAYTREGLVDLVLHAAWDICSGLRGKGPGGEGNNKKKTKERERAKQGTRVSSAQSANHLSPRRIFYIVRITDENSARCMYTRANGSRPSARTFCSGNRFTKYVYIYLHNINIFVSNVFFVQTKNVDDSQSVSK